MIHAADKDGGAGLKHTVRVCFNIVAGHLRVHATHGFCYRHAIAMQLESGRTKGAQFSNVCTKDAAGVHIQPHTQVLKCNSFFNLDSHSIHCSGPVNRGSVSSDAFVSR